MVPFSIPSDSPSTILSTTGFGLVRKRRAWGGARLREGLRFPSNRRFRNLLHQQAAPCPDRLARSIDSSLPSRLPLVLRQIHKRPLSSPHSETMESSWPTMETAEGSSAHRTRAGTTPILLALQVSPSRTSSP